MDIYATVGHVGVCSGIKCTHNVNVTHPSEREIVNTQCTQSVFCWWRATVAAIL